MNALTVATHAAVFLAGVATGLLLVKREGHRLTQEQPMTTRTRRRVPVLVVALLVVSGFLIGFAFQQMAAQRDADRRDACYQDWGRQVVETIGVRTDATSEVTAAEGERDDSVDAILAVFVAALFDRPPPTEGETRQAFISLLEDFSVAKRNLDAAEKRAGTTRQANPYPALDC